MNNGKLTPEITTEICNKIKNGANRKTAALTSGITEQTFYNWIARGKQAKNGKYLEFFESIKKAEESLKEFYENKIKTAKSWTAAAWWLERKHPEEYRNRQQIEHSGDVSYEVRFVKEKNDSKKN